jgi:alkylhydroperoxidase/carboxymuconolactone decarboxylase family protein YurZ
MTTEQQIEPRRNGLTPLEIVSAIAVFVVMVATGALMSGLQI